jgi:hypothetical protein
MELKSHDQAAADSVKRGETDGFAALADMKRKDRVNKLIEISSANEPLSSVGRRFPVLLCDPPWRYEHALHVTWGGSK